MLNKFNVIDAEVMSNVKYNKITGEVQVLKKGIWKPVTTRAVVIDGKSYPVARIAYFANFGENPANMIVRKDTSKPYVKSNLIVGEFPFKERVRSDRGLPKNVYLSRTSKHPSYTVIVNLHKLIHVGTYTHIDDAVNARDFALKNPRLFQR